MNSNIKVAKLYDVVRAPIDTFRELGTDLSGSYGQLVYIDRGASILGVAHLDSVARGYHFDEMRWKNQHVVFTESLDDRLGAYILLDVLPALGIECDVLLTDNEESCRSTAEYFRPEKKYNWMFQFDRAGTDTVMYEYESDSLIKAIEEFGMVWGFGSYSDICELEHLGIKGLNIGTGYYDNHTSWSHAVLTETDMMIRIFKRFYEKYKDVSLPHEPGTGRGYSSGRGYSRGWSDCNWDNGPSIDDEARDNFSQFIEVESEEGRMFVPQWRLAEFMRDNPGTKVMHQWEDITHPPKDYVRSWARMELDDEPKIDADIYKLVFAEERDNGATDREAHKVAWAASVLNKDDLSPYDEKCLVCGDARCCGLDSCEVCGLTTHGDLLTKQTGLCSNCHAKIVQAEGVDDYADRSVWM